jgi:hypothetical protein
VRKHEARRPPVRIVTRAVLRADRR